MAGTIDSFSHGKKCSFVCKTFSLFLPCSMAAVQNLYMGFYGRLSFFPFPHPPFPFLEFALLRASFRFFFIWRSSSYLYPCVLIVLFTVLNCYISFPFSELFRVINNKIIINHFIKWCIRLIFVISTIFINK